MHIENAPDTWDYFRDRARTLLAANISPDVVMWQTRGAQSDLLLAATSNSAVCDVTSAAAPLHVPRSFIETGVRVALHNSPDRWSLLYTALWRITHGERALMEIAADPLVSRLSQTAKSVKRDMHKMTAFVRFRSVQVEGEEHFVAWYEPDHFIVGAVAPFFARRFPSMTWSILTPQLCVHHSDGNMHTSPGVDRASAPAVDTAESLWLSYYSSIFNPARIKLKAMRNEMPVRFWSNLPETALIPQMLRDAPERVEKMLAQAATLAAPTTSSPRATRVHVGMTHAADGDGSEGADGAARSSHRARTGSSRATTPRIRIGVAGWDYPDWAGVIYSSDRTEDRLRAVARQVDLVEVNSTFYRPASRKAATSWLDRTSDMPALRFAAKLWRRFTHENSHWGIHDVRMVRDGFELLHESGKLDSIVVQFPWSFKHGQEERDRIERIAHDLNGLPLHVEVRHDSWLEGGIVTWLRERGLGFVNIDQPALRSCIGPTSHASNGRAYVRLHGRNAENWFDPEAGRDARYDYDYPTVELATWVEHVGALDARDDVESVDVVFNNHYRGRAVHNAASFATLLNGR